MKYIFHNSHDLLQALITTIRQDIVNDSFEKRSFKEVYADLHKAAQVNKSMN